MKDISQMPRTPGSESRELEHPDRSRARSVPHPNRDLRDTSLRRQAERPRAPERAEARTS